MTIFNEVREIEVIKKNVARLSNKKYSKLTESFFNNLMTLSRSLQEEVFEEVLPTVTLESSSLPTGFNNTVINSTDGNGNAVFNKELKQFVITGTGNVIGKDLGATDSYQFVNFEVKR